MYDDDYPDDYDDEDIGSTTIPCHYCGEEIYDDVDQCPKCGQYLIDSDRSAWSNKPKWMINLAVGLVVLAALGFVAPYLLTLIQLMLTDR